MKAKLAVSSVSMFATTLISHLLKRHGYESSAAVNPDGIMLIILPMGAEMTVVIHAGVNEGEQRVRSTQITSWSLDMKQSERTVSVLSGEVATIIHSLATEMSYILEDAEKAFSV